MAKGKKTNALANLDNREPFDWVRTALPSFEGSKVFIVPGAFYGQTVLLFAQAGFLKANRPEDADIVVFLGGEDVDPGLYGQRPLPCVFYDVDRDQEEKSIYEMCVEKGVFIAGICRGAQLIHVLNGFTLWQDVNHHAGPDHWIIDLERNCRVMATSLHHQMLKPTDSEGCEVFAVAQGQVATRFEDEGHLIKLENRFFPNKKPLTEIEGAYYPMTGCFVVQGHPEIGSAEYRSWFLVRLQEYYDRFIKEREDYEKSIITPPPLTNSN